MRSGILAVNEIGSISGKDKNIDYYQSNQVSPQLLPALDVPYSFPLLVLVLLELDYLVPVPTSAIHLGFIGGVWTLWAGGVNDLFVMM